MRELRTCPLCGRDHEVTNGAIPTWIVDWTGDELPVYGKYHQRLRELRAKYNKQPDPESGRIITNRSSCFIHYEDAVGEYNWIKNILVERGDWHIQQQYLTITEDSASWHELFESPEGVWIA